MVKKNVQIYFFLKGKITLLEINNNTYFKVQTFTVSVYWIVENWGKICKEKHTWSKFDRCWRTVENEMFDGFFEVFRKEYSREKFYISLNFLYLSTHEFNSTNSFTCKYYS